MPTDGTGAHPATLTALNLYRLTGSADVFTDATRALAERVEAEGHPGVLGYRFFVDAGQGVGRAVVDYADGAAWIGHHDLAMGWPEMSALHAAARFEEVTLLGPVPQAVHDWLARSTLRVPIREGFAPAAGFARWAPPIRGCATANPRLGGALIHHSIG